MAQMQIGKDVFSVSPLLGEQSFLLQPKIAPAISEFLTLYRIFVESFVGITEGGKVDLDAELGVKEVLGLVGPALEQAAPVLERLCAKLPGERLQEIVRTLLASATMNGTILYSTQGNPIDVLLQGRTLDFWRLVVFALQTSYPDFFGVLGAFRAPAKEAAPSAT